MSKCNCVCYPVCCCPVDSVECKQALKLVEEKFTSTNSDLMQLLGRSREVFLNSEHDLDKEQADVVEAINAALAQKH